MPTYTLFTPFCGRIRCLDKYLAFLENQTWPKEDIFLLFLDTSQDSCKRFKKQLEHWMLQCRYPYKLLVKKKYHDIENLADLPRPENRKMVNETVAAIYNDLTRWVTTEYTWVIEDDTIPPPNACTELMKGFLNDEETFSVTASYPLNPRNKSVRYVVWKDFRNERPPLREKGQGIEQIQGNGFGCVILKNSYFKETSFSYQELGYDVEYYEKQSGIAKINWDVECEHICNEIKVL